MAKIAAGAALANGTEPDKQQVQQIKWRKTGQTMNMAAACIMSRSQFWAVPNWEIRVNDVASGRALLALKYYTYVKPYVINCGVKKKIGVYKHKALT